MGKLKFDMQTAIFVADNGDLMHTTKMLYSALDRIAELERLLVESEAISLHNFRRYGAAIGEGHISNMDHRIGWSDLPEEQRKAIIESHRYLLKCEGKL